jgi:plasmid maintenance system antidote protein VapI
MGVTVRAVRYWVTGERRLGGQMLRRMSEVLGVEPEQLLAVPESTP